MTAGGRLVLVGTPLGNREDLSPRARAAIVSADLLLCEDTRSPRRLLGEGVELPPRKSCFVGNESERVAELLSRLSAGQTVAFVSEAGMPVWSDPGRALVRAAIEAGQVVDVIPGPTAAATALCHSGFAAEGTTFFGFVAREGSDRANTLARIATHDGAAILYEAGNRVSALLSDLASVCPDVDARQIVIARELTKVHQEIRRGTLRELADAIAEPLRGEVTIVIEATRATAAEDPVRKGARAVVDAMLDPSLRPRERAKALAELTGLDARTLYDRLRDR